MNEYQKNLYANLMDLVADSKTFYFADQSIGGIHFRIFNYRMAGYMEFMQPDALECRGHMFQISEPGDNAKMLRLAALPMEKFFNLNENPSTMDLDLSTVNLIEDKADGSLISTYFTAHEMDTITRFKTKGSLTSDQAKAATHHVNVFTPLLKQELRQLTVRHYTVNMEWCSPDNRIVIGYMEPELRVLNIRNNMTGEYVEKEEIAKSYPSIAAFWTQRFFTEDPEDFLSRVPNQQNIEGYVIRLESGQRVKLKTGWYLALHRTKDNINSPRRLFEAVMEEATDDMKVLFHDDPLALRTIEEMEVWGADKYNTMVDAIETFYTANKDLDRKDYAIKGKAELDPMYFGLAMSKYLNKPVNYKEFLKGKWKQLGLKDLEKDDE